MNLVVELRGHDGGVGLRWFLDGKDGQCVVRGMASALPAQVVGRRSSGDDDDQRLDRVAIRPDARIAFDQAEEPEERLLRDILGAINGPDVARQVVEHTALVSSDDLAKPILVAGDELLQYRSVAQRNVLSCRLHDLAEFERAPPGGYPGAVRGGAGIPSGNPLHPPSPLGTLRGP